MAAPQMVIKIVGDVAGLQAALARGEAAVTALGPSVAKLAATWKTHSDKLVTDAANVTAAVAQIGAKTLTAADSASALKKLEAAMAQLRASGQPIPPLMAQTASQLHALHPAATTAASGLTAVKTLLGSLGLTLGVGALVLGVKRFVSSLFEMGDSLTKLHSRSGIAIEDLQVLGTVAMRGGTDLETLIGAINMMQKRVAGDDDSAVRALRFLKIDIAALQTLTPDQWFYTVSKAINAVGDAALRTKLRTDIMGRGASEVADAMVQDFEAAREATVKMSAGTAIALDNAGEKLSLWVRNLKVWTVGVVVALYDQCVRIVDIALITLDKMLAGFYGKWAVFLGSIAQSGVLGPTVSGVLYSKAAEASWLSTFYTDTAKAHEAALEREAVAALSAAAGTGKASASLDGLSKAGEKAAAEVAKIRDHMYGRDAMKQLETWGAAIGDLNKIAGLAPAIQDEWRAAVEKAEKALGKMTPELKRFADVIPLVSRAIELSQMTRATGGVTGWPGLTSWAASQPGYASISSSGIPPLPSTDLSGMLWSLPGAYTGNMRAGQLLTTTAPAWAQSLNDTLSQLPQNLLGAAMGGGDYWKTISMTFAQQGAKQLEPMFEGIFGKGGAKLGDWQISNQALAGAANAGLTMLGQYAATKTGPGWGALSGSIQGAQSGGWQGAIAGYLIGAVTGAYDEAKAKWEDVKARRGAYEAAHGGLEKLNQQAAAVGLTLEKFYNPRKTGDLAAAIAELDAAFAKLDTSIKTLARISSEGGLLKKEVVADLVRAAHYLPEVREKLQEFYISETQRGIKGLGQWTAGLTALTAASAPGATGAALAYWESLEAQGLSLVEILDTLGPQIATIQAALTAAGLSGGAAFETIARIVTATTDPAVRQVLETVTGLNTVLETVFNMGQMTQEIFGGLIAGVAEQYQGLLRMGKLPEEARRLVRQPLQTIWELQQTYQFVVDEATQRLLQEALGAGEIGEAFRPAADRMTAAIDRLIAKFDVLIGVLTPGGAGGGAGAALIQVRPGLATGGREVTDLDVLAHSGRLLTAHGGALLGPLDRTLALMATWPRAHAGLAPDEVPFIGLTGERVLSREQTRAYDQGQRAAGSQMGPPIQIIVKTYLDGRQIAESVVPEIPGVVKRYGLT